MKAAFPLVFALFALLALAACGGAPQQQALPVNLVPDGSNLIAQVQVARILDDQQIAALIESAPREEGGPQNLDQLLQMARDETGIDFRQFQEAVLFGDVSRDDEYIGIIARGSFDESAIIAAMEEKSGSALTTSDYKGRRLHIPSGETDNPVMSVLGDELLALGTEEAVRAVIDVHNGDRPRSSGKVYDTFVDQGDVLFRIALEMPPQLSDDLEEPLEGFPGGEGELPFDMSAFADLSTVGVSVDKDASNMKVRAQMEFTSVESATRMRDLIDGFLSFFGALSADQQARDLLDRIEIELRDTTLTISLEAPLEDLEGLGSALGGS